MRYIITGLVLFISLNTFSQKKIRNIDTFYSAIKAITIKDTVQSDAVSQVIKAAPDIKANNWSNTVYNPYKEVKVSFPLQIKFDDSSYAAPVKRKKVVTSRYGWRRGRAHEGIDIDLITGDSLYSMFGGIVRMARYTSGHGRTVVVRHYNGLETVYAHLSKYGVKENDTVAKGQYLGKGGTSGNARGSHLHLVINYKGVPINPEYLFKFNEKNEIRNNELWVTKKWTQPVFHSSRRQSKITPLFTEAEAIASLQKKRSIYVVRPGDTLSRISRNNDVSVASICKVNRIRKTSVIKVGQKLFIEK
ncbi:peptidoglycan DD-metalloendopeptidase family protein [Seonamhaeicola marinus]|uniref:Peptidoglycan DD-metalloendopeptidase family protein n=1 Tax=Seonamhaeicola marinus TaxID=1912246 RepID=A0A5D0HKW7_9FLAO|nr:M23 family metallopeptidase [Seonamhaeicola marinus]TYA71956.1 peptidoglycan DD-metalloendopeptidase family protein [Seonamhaeicola marinus]